MSMLEKLYTVDDIAMMASVTTRTIRTYIKNGLLKGKKVGGQWRFSQEDVNRFMQISSAAGANTDGTRRAVMEFLDGAYAQQIGVVQSCTVLDIYDEAQYAMELRDELSEFINYNSLDPEFFRFEWEYDAEQARARFTIIAAPEFAIEAMRILSGEEDE